VCVIEISTVMAFGAEKNPLAYHSAATLSGDAWLSAAVEFILRQWPNAHGDDLIEDTPREREMRY